MSVFTYTAQRGFSLLGNEVGAWLADTVDETLVGVELVANGDFTTDTVGWGNISSTILSVSGELEVTSITANGLASQNILCLTGQTYIASVKARAGTSAHAILDIEQSPDDVLWLPDTSTTDVALSLTFVASGTSFNILLRAGIPGTAYFDNASVRLAVPDLSSSNSGLGVYGSIVKSPVNTGADLVGYSGFSAADYLEQPYNSSLDFGLDDFCLMAWVKFDASVATQTIFERSFFSGGYSGGGHIRATLGSTGALAFYITDDDYITQDVVITPDVDYDDGAWRLVSFGREGANWVIAINGARIAITPVTNTVATLNNATAILRVGYSVAGTTPATTATISLARVMAFYPTVAQQRAIHNKEKHLFDKHSFYTQEGLLYTLEMVLQANPRSVKTFRDDNVSFGRTQTETHLDGDDVEFSLTTGVMSRVDSTHTRIAEFSEFMFGTRASELFTIDFYGTVAAPDEVKTFIRTSKKYTESAKGGQWRTASFVVKQL